ncbi:flagellar M-ring protein FliF [Xenorhabdus nematophila]|uniref:Flagellar M-ring protein n=1 Tax=Xenorhabdus nematophila (strain ATCC 19061 / DSM 3370 / CCUG 14189 / LMG 1036 / NCIMB 9965 / AN6) TaxID=406817 RepID=D3VC90_XENNA|nr:flagellar basal-body MS-ring/collar protein FliF [Xenorhabdus nematophila]CEE92493.1 flagellar biosynthesis; basal-body MS(membrane and supramembrane)-ring and collar protein [Xenorhabdus nematophila str. Anatoliense]CEF32184.1 flagellar biosynthesis; basal-body MS(membrane and supramembrane)-ring and collar protein [Xenorhabdus nematophila str. Websteri]AYA40594.1 flagellar basal body M-ring protein FliF [Xenorhabdus nematophila]MBA0019333.1 flagellar M-ring protein FliF [Xenorhabdus nemato
MSATNDVENQKKGFSAIISRIKADPKVPLLVAGSAAIAIVVALFLWLRSPDYRVLYSNLSDKDGGEIVTQLTQMNVPYRFAENGSAIMIPTEKVHETRLKLAQQGLPKGGATGFELLDKEKFGISQFSEQVNYQRALEGELARTVESLGPVQSARVHLAMPKPSLFVREQKSPSASVTVGLLQGRVLDEGQINAIVHMVSSSVAGLPAGNVTIVDQSGRLLTQSDATGRDLNTTQLKYTQEIENRFRHRIETILAPVVGRGNVHAQVTAQVDFSRREETTEEYKPNQPPNQAAVRSKQSSSSEQSGGPLVGGVPGALSNQPSAAPSAPIEKPNTNANTNAKDNSDEKPDQQQRNGNNRNNSYERMVSNNHNNRYDETTNYEVDRTIRHTQLQAGAVERLSVAVVVNYTMVQGENGPETKPLMPEQLAQIEALTREAIGFSTDRGDSLNVTNTPFNDTTEVIEALPFWQHPVLLDKLLDAGRWLLLALAAWLLWRKMIVPQIAKKRAAEKAALDAQKNQQKRSAETNAEMDEKMRRQMARQRVNAELQSQRIRELAEKDPRVVALVIRQWMSNEQ